MITKQKKRNVFLVVIGLSVASVTVATMRLLTPVADPETVEVPVIISLTITATPGQAITTHADSVVLGTGYSLTDFRCNYDSGSGAACDGSFTVTVYHQ